MSDAESEARARKAALLLFVIAYSWTFVQFAFGFGGSALGKGSENLEVARTLAARGEFSDPFGSLTGPTAHVAPVYPLLTAVVLKGFGSNNASLFASLFLNALLLGGAVGLLPALSAALYGAVAPGFVAGLLVVAGSKASLQSEAFCSAFFLIAASHSILSRRAALSGIISGLAILANRVNALAIAFLVAIRGARYAAAVASIAACFAAPWMIRNWLVLGAPYFVRDNFGLELFVSNQDIADPELIRNPALVLAHPSAAPKETELVRTLGERRYNSLRLRNAIDWILSHPAKFLRLTAIRAIYYWFPPFHESWQTCGYWIVTILSLIGFWLGRKRRTSNLLAAASIASYLIYTVVQADVRYRYPVLWIQALAGGFALTIPQRTRVKMAAGMIPKSR